MSSVRFATVKPMGSCVPLFSVSVYLICPTTRFPLGARRVAAGPGRTMFGLGARFPEPI
jgi:hypothetical protein